MPTITIELEDIEDCRTVLEKVIELVEEGFKEGYEPMWNLED